MTMTKTPAVEFVMLLSEFQKAAKQLSLNRGEFKKTDCADLLVSSFAVIFRSVGTTAEAPVEGTRPGAVRLPLILLPKILEVARTYKKQKLKWHFEQGTMRIEKFSWSHPDISLGTLPDPKLDLPSDAGPLQTLAMASLLSPEEIADQGWRERVEVAQRQASIAISGAAQSLDQLGISRHEIEELVDASIQRTATLLRSSSRTS